MKKLDPSVVLPRSLTIPSSGKHFYRFGFSLHKNGCTYRSPLYHPLLVFIIPTLLTIRFFYSVLTPDHSFHFHLYMGDFGYFMNLKFHLNLTAGLVYWVSIFSQIIHFIDYKRDKKQPYMKVFNMMSGSLSPQSIGLTEEQLIRGILKRSRLAFKCNDFFRYSITFVAFFISVFSYITRLSLLEMLLLGLPHSIFFGFGSLYIYNVICTQLFYFYIISYYLNSKQREVNNYLRNVIKNKEKIRIYNSNQMISKLDNIYLEIKQYDSAFWSKFLACMWVSCTCIVALIIFMFAFGQKMHSVVRLILFYAIFWFSSILLIVIQTAGSINFEVKQAYKLLASYKLVTIKTQQSVIPKARHGLKFLSIFERIGIKKKNKIGFSCFKLFVINYFRGFEVILMCAVVLLKIIQREMEKRNQAGICSSCSEQ